MCLETLVSCGLSGPTSPLAFGESVLGTVSGSVEAVENKEHLWRMWSVVVNPLTDTITQVCSVYSTHIYEDEQIFKYVFF